jgi:hypothetical protein
MIKEADELFKSILTPATLQAIAITDTARVAAVGRLRRISEAIREVYYQFLATRLNHSEIFINEAQNAREALI